MHGDGHTTAERARVSNVAYGSHSFTSCSVEIRNVILTSWSMLEKMRGRRRRRRRRRREEEEEEA